jgi:hypothetical protein
MDSAKNMSQFTLQRSPFVGCSVYKKPSLKCMHNANTIEDSRKSVSRNRINLPTQDATVLQSKFIFNRSVSVIGYEHQTVGPPPPPQTTTKVRVVTTFVDELLSFGETTRRGTVWNLRFWWEIRSSFYTMWRRECGKCNDVSEDSATSIHNVGKTTSRPGVEFELVIPVYEW